MRLIFIHSIIIFSLLLFTAAPGSAGDGKWNTVGLRAGIGDSRNSESFSQYEAYVTFSLPWRWESDSKWIIGSFIGANAGAVICEDNAFMGSIGPGVYIMTPVERVVISAGIYPTYIGRSRFGTEDFGESFQFTSAVGINLNFLQHMTIGYRFQHMSNAGISDENPGLNTHMIEMGYRF
jgi:lipid A 3-O-deacylase